MDADVRSQVTAMLADLFQVEIAADAGDVRRDEIAGWDSISHLHLVLELEQTFQIAIGDDEVVELNSLGDILALLASRGIALREVDA